MLATVNKSQGEGREAEETNNTNKIHIEKKETTLFFK